jgi:hypothetical protein
VTKKQVSRYVKICADLSEHGLDEGEVAVLICAERALTRWSCRECGDGSNWHIERDDDGKPYEVYNGPGGSRSYPIRDRERFEMDKAERIAKKHGLTVYRQRDPRGCALYLMRPGDVRPGEQVDACYHRGIALCID